MFKKKLNLRFLPYLIYVCTSIVFIWMVAGNYLKDGYIVAGHDSGLPLDTKEFLETRFYAWDERVGFGQDNSSLFGSIILHGVDHVLAYLSGQEAAGNVLALTFWLGLIFISAFIFAYSIKDKVAKYFTFIFPPLVTINFFIFQSIFILERSKYELVSALLLFMAIIFKLQDRKIKVLTASILASLIFFFLNGGGWIGLPSYGGIIIFTLTFLCLESISAVINGAFRDLIRLLSFLILTSVFVVLLNSYSMLPYIVTFKNVDSGVLADEGTKKAYIEWIGSLSHGASFLNLFRLQGVPDWFNYSYTLSPGHPFAQTYFEDKKLILASFLFPILAMLSFILIKTKAEKKIVVYFGVITLVGMFFVAGTHPPLGLFYEFIFNNVPGFVIFRSPYYKFGSLMFIGLSVLIAFSVSSLITHVVSKFKISGFRNTLAFALISLSVSFWLLYHYKLYEPNIFSWQKGYSSRIKVPDYIYEFGKFAEQNLSDERILMLPPLDRQWRSDSYNFGYWSLSTLPYSLSSKNYLVNGFSLNKEEEEWVNQFYLQLENGSPDFLDTAQRLNTGYILLRKDAITSFQTPDYETLIKKFSEIKKIKDFDNWHLYRIENNKNQSIYLVNSVSAVAEGNSTLARDFLQNDKSAFFKETNGVNNFDQFTKLKIFSLICSTCALETYEITNRLPEITVLPDSIIYKYKIYKEKQEIESATSDSGKISSYLAFILRRTSESFRMVIFGFQEKYVKENFDTINTYLDEIQGLVEITSDPTRDYKTLETILGSLGPVENNLRNFIAGKEFLVRSEDLRGTILGTMMRIYKIKAYYKSLLQDFDTLRVEKKYLIDTLPQNSRIFLKDLSLPLDLEEKPIYPKEIIISQEDKMDLAVLEKDAKPGWTEIKLPSEQNGKKSIILSFDRFPNLYQPLGLSIETAPSGEKNCLRGSIANFNNQRIYEVSIRARVDKPLLKLIFKDESPEGEFKFLVGNPDVNIYPVVSYEPFRYVYRPSPRDNNPTVYVCSDNKEIPSIEDIQIYQLVSPQLIVVQENNPPQLELPEIDVKKVDPTKYIVEVKNAKDPFILNLNQRYSLLWKINYDQNELAKLANTVNGEDPDHVKTYEYSNGWIVNKTGNYILTVEYTPQSLFNLGYKITLSLLFFSCVYLVYLIRKKYVSRND